MKDFKILPNVQKKNPADVAYFDDIIKLEIAKKKEDIFIWKVFFYHFGSGFEFQSRSATLHQRDKIDKNVIP